MSFLELADIRSFAKASRSLYRNIYNPNFKIFQSLRERIIDQVTHFDSYAKPFYQRKQMIRYMNTVSDFDDTIHVSTLWNNTLKSSPLILSYESSSVTCNATVNGIFSNLKEISTQREFETIRHWMAHCLNTELYRVNIKSLVDHIMIIIPTQAYVPLSYFSWILRPIKKICKTQ